MSSNSPAPSTSNLHVEASTGFVICIPCKTALPSMRRAREHLTSAHNLPSLSAKEQSSIAFSTSNKISTLTSSTRQLYLSAPFKPSSSTEKSCPLPPLQSLLTESGYQCSSCPLCFRSERKMKAHISTEHFPTCTDEELNTHWDAIHSKGSMDLQSIYGGNKTRLFPVSASLITSPTPDTQSTTTPVSAATTHPMSTLSNPSHATPSITQHCPPTTPSPSNSPNTPNVSIGSSLQSLMNNSFTVPEESNRNKINPFIDIGKFDEILSDNNISMTDAYNFSAAAFNLDSNESRIFSDIKQYLFHINTIRSYISPSLLTTVNLRSNNQFSLVSHSSIDRYSRSFARFAISAYRMISHPSLPPLVKSSLSTYLNSINQEIQPQSQSHHLHQFLKSICLCHFELYEGSQPLFIRLFIACCTIINDSRRDKSLNLRFADASEMTHLLSALQYSISCCCVTEIYNIGQESSNSSASSPSSLLEKQTMASKCLSTNENTSASFLRSTLDLASGIAKNDEADTQFEDCISHTSCGIINGTHLSLPQQGDIVKTIHSNIDSIIKDRLLFNSSLPSSFQSQLASLTDDVSNKSPGFSFLNHKQTNIWIIQNMKWLLSELQQNPKANASLFSSPSNHLPSPDITQVEGINMSIVGIQRWLDACQDIQEALLACIHLSSGLPGRGTELETFNISNTPYATRNVFISQSDIILICRYSKTRTMTKSDRPITRLPDNETSYRLKLYLCLFKGLETTMIGSLYGSDAMQSHWSSLFARRGAPFRKQEIRSIIRETFIAHNINLNFNHLRHHASAMVRKVANSCRTQDVDDLESELYSLGHLQAGHSIDTAERLYGRRNTDFSQTSYSNLTNIRFFCAQWHLFLGLNPCHHVRSEKSSLPLQSSPLPPSAHSTGGVNNLQQCTKRPSSPFKSSHSSYLNQQDVSFIDPFSKRIKISPSIVQSPSTCTPSLQTPKPNITSINPTPYLSALRTLLRNQDATFKSQLQLSITINILKNSDNLLVVMPTGSGKSMCFFLPIHMEDSNHCSILIEPLVALVNDMKSRASTLGIRTGTWENRKDTTNLQLLILSAEHLRHPDFPSLINTLQSSNRLTRLIFDEAHLGLLCQDFRPSLRFIKTSLSKTSIQCPIILLTATCPPSSQSSLISHFGITDIIVHRSTTVRKNLHFKCINIDNNIQHQGKSGQFISTEENIINTVTTLLRQKLSFLQKSHSNGKVMIFSLTRGLSIKIYNHLHQLLSTPSVTILNYHSGMPDSQRQHIQSVWSSPPSNNQTSFKIISCTSAFGTGIDVPDVHAVYHAGGAYGIPEYIQEVGRAGRDNKTADCILVFSPSYATKFSTSMEGMKSESIGISEEEYDEKLQRWSQFISYAQNTSVCRKSFLYRLVDDEDPGYCLFDESSINCDICNTMKDSVKPVIPDIPPSNPPLPKSIPIQSTPSQPPIIPNEDIVLDHKFIESITPKPSPKPQITPTTRPKQSTIHRFRTISRRLHGLCIHCLVLRSRYNPSTHSCSLKQSRCLRCQSDSHSLKDCKLSNTLSGQCYKCFLRNCEGEPVHPNGFGKNCPYGICKDLCWLLWHSQTWRKRIVSLFEPSILQKYNAISSRDEISSSALFQQWICNISRPIPNIIRLILWWNEQTNKM